MFHPTVSILSVDFRAISCPVERLTAKEYIFAWLNERIPDVTSAAASSTIRRSTHATRS